MSRTTNSIPNNLNPLNDALIILENQPSFENSLKAVNEIIGLFGVSPDSSPKPFNDSRGKIRDHAGWFMEAQGFGDRRACYIISEGNKQNLDFKFYWVQKSSKRVISTVVALTPNFEDEPFYQKEAVGVDFVIPKEADRIIIALSSNYTIRTIELHGALTITQQEIFTKWAQPFDFGNKKEVHSTLWSSFDLEPLNKRFYQDVTRFFTELVQYLSKEKNIDNKHAALFTNRLIGRLIFCWFIRKRGIISNEHGYFEIAGESSTIYYKQKLEKLFFTVLNTPIDEREKIAGYDSETPFLNGGLFEARPGDYYGVSKIEFPKDYFHRFFDFLNHYNFTTDESTSSFQQVAIDPEMLGRIFENLLAEQTEDTGEQARKAKGAFYTPREVVDYMCRESLRAYIADKLPDDDKKNYILELLLDKKEHEFDNKNHRADLVAYKKYILEALDEVKVLDPACGSGAFPMGMLQLMLTLYERLETRFDAYKTKLAIIEKNLHGIDIEPMAVEIARLRVWLSIVVDEEVNPKAKNMGIDPLPNLDFKFVCANSLIPLEKNTGLFDDENIAQQMQDIRDRYFNTQSLKIKNDMKKKFLDVLMTTRSLFATKKQEQLGTYKPFDTENSCSFFDAEFMFGKESSHFDIVIGNPPYVNIRKVDKTVKVAYQDHYSSASGQYDLYVLFIEKSLSLLKENGYVCLITPNKFLISSYGKGIRKIIAEETTLKDFVDHSRDNIFEGVGVYPIVFLLKNRPHEIEISDDYNLLKIFDFEKKDSVLEKLNSVQKTLIDFCFIKEAIHTGNIREKLIVKEKINDNCFPLLRGKDCDRYAISWKGLFINYDYVPQKGEAEYASMIDKKYFLDEKIFLREIALRPTATYDDEGYFCLNKAYVVGPKEKNVNLKYILGLLNSKLIAYFFEKKFGDLRVGGGYLQFKKQFTSKIPIIIGDDTFSSEITDLVNQILELKKEKSSTKDLEDRIDEMVLTLYGLSDEEKAIIKNS